MRMWINGFTKNHLTIISIGLNVYIWEGLKGIKIHNAVSSGSKALLRRNKVCSDTHMFYIP